MRSPPSTLPTAMALMTESTSVYPSGTARATWPVPSVAPAPGRFSTTTDCPSRRDISPARMRAMMSVVPPGPKGTTNRIGLGLRPGRLGERRRGEGAGEAEDGAARDGVGHRPPRPAGAAWAGRRARPSLPRSKLRRAPGGCYRREVLDPT
jgi:hypothetical protein